MIELIKQYICDVTGIKSFNMNDFIIISYTGR